MYRTKTFQARPRGLVFADIETATRAWLGAHRVFLAGVDAPVLPTGEMLTIFDKLAASFPNLARVSSYAMLANLIKKSVDELAGLKRAKLTLLYYGLESGDAGILRRVTKGASPRAIIQGLDKARDAGLKISATVILGLGGRAHWRNHIECTAAVVKQAAPNFLSTLQLALDPMIEAEFHQRFGEPCEPQGDAGMLVEQQHLIAQLDPPTPVIFGPNSTSNALPLAGTLPKDREAILAALGAAQVGAIPLRPTHCRGH